jgi:hypothetical protein
VSAMRPPQLLVWVREEIAGSDHLLRQILCSGRGLDQRANIRHERGILAVEQRLNVRQVGVEGKSRCGRQGKQCILSQSQGATKGCVVGVSNGVKRNDGVVRVIAAKQEHADQSFVIRTGLRQGVHHAKRAQPQRASGGSQRGELNETAAVESHLSCSS